MQWEPQVEGADRQRWSRDWREREREVRGSRVEREKRGLEKEEWSGERTGRRRVLWRRR